MWWSVWGHRSYKDSIVTGEVVRMARNPVNI